MSELTDKDAQADKEKFSKNSQSMSASQQGNISVDIENYLKDLTHLFVILSHPDKDYVNCISKDNIPNDLYITVLCEGDWFGKKNSSGTNLTEDICELWTFLKEEKKRLLNFLFIGEAL